MRRHTCRCGAMEFLESGMVPWACSRCDACGSGYDGREAAPHAMVAHPVETDAGPATLSRCAHCYRTRAQILTRDPAAVFQDAGTVV